MSGSPSSVGGALRILSFVVTVFVLVCNGFGQQESKAQMAATGGPSIYFAEPMYNFGTVNSGKTYNHRYWFTNTGNATLEITNVHSTCGCTTLGDWPRTVPPGASGSIGIQFNSTKVIGNIEKLVLVYSNDRQRPIVNLTIAGRVGHPIEFGPKWVYFNAPAGASASPVNIVTITNSAKELLSVFDARSTNEHFTVRLLTNQLGREYRLEIASAQLSGPGVARGAVEVKTSSPDLPLITIPTMVNAQPAVAILPAQIQLPPAPLPNALTNIIVLQYTGTSTNFSVTNCAVNAPNVRAMVKSLTPGKLFQVLLAFPVGFSAPAGCEFSAQTTDANQSIVKAPISHQNANGGAGAR